MTPAPRRAAFVALALVGIIAAIWAWMGARGALPGERQLSRALQGSDPYGPVGSIFEFLGQAGTDGVAGVTVAIAIALVLRTLGWRAAVIVIVAAAAVPVNVVIQQLLGPRPSALGDFGAGVEGFPSGHVVYATAVFGALAWLGWHHGRRDASAVLLGLTIAMGVARIATGAHFPSDVAAGYALGSAWLIGVIATLGPPLLRSPAVAGTQP